MEIGEKKHLLFPLLHMLERKGGCIGEDIEDASGGGTGTQGVEEAVRRTVRYLIDVGVLSRLANGKGNDECCAGGRCVAGPEGDLRRWFRNDMALFCESLYFCSHWTVAVVLHTYKYLLGTYLVYRPLRLVRPFDSNPVSLPAGQVSSDETRSQISTPPSFIQT